MIFESGGHDYLDFVIGVKAPKHLRIFRTMKRDNSSREQVLARMEKQLDEEIKMRLCDFVIINDDREALLRQVLNLYNKLTEMATSKM